MTKKLILSLLIGLTASNTLLAQSNADKVFKTFRFGLYTGPTFNSLRPVATEAEGYVISKVKGNVGFSLGLCADYNINERYTVFSGLSLDWRGGTVAVVDKDSILQSGYIYKNEVKYNLQYLTIPIGLKMKAAEFDKIKIFAQTGIDIAFLLSQKGDISTTLLPGATAITAEKVKLGGVAKSTPVNAGWMLGVGAEYELNDKNSVYATLLYRNGFTDVTTPKLNTSTVKFSDGNIRFNTIALRVGYYF